ncbi:TetR/AcrR family transcriptional regulator [Wenyingzhuangia sp. IMCC45574]
MARKKQYTEEEVIEKATNLFWKNGYETTSMQMLEREMGINKFSIYSSFGSKDGVFLACVKNYSRKISSIQSTLKKSNNGLEGIKQYFFDFLSFSREYESQKGCLITNTFNEKDSNMDEIITKELFNFTDNMKMLIKMNLEQENRGEEFVNTQTEYLMIALYGLASASKSFKLEQLDIYINNIFLSI